MAAHEVLDDFSSGEACSGGCGDLGDFLLDERAELELAEHFEQAAQHAQNLTHVASTEQLLYLYARYKLVKVGKCTTSKPGFFDYEGKQKWDAWKSLGDYSTQQAKYEYITTIKMLDPGWIPKPFEDPAEEPRSTFSGRVVSCLYQVQEAIRDEDKDIFDHCRDNNLSRIAQALATGAIDVNVADEEGRGLLHWACDRGHRDLVNNLLFHNAHINMKDYEGQTPLHYAAACEFSDIVDLLLDHGADSTLKDNDGFKPQEVTDSKQISEMLKQHATFGEHDKSPSLLEFPK